jgi:shikimate kinase
MIIDAKTFDEKLNSGTLKTAFVGMSNTGKTYTARAFEEDCGFVNHCVDNKIVEALGVEDVEGLAKWLGYPGDSGFPEREEEYLRLENVFTLEIPDHDGKNLVLDTTGSHIYLPQATQQWVRDNFLVVELEVTKEKKDRMLESFFQHPKPVVWNGLFSIESGESKLEALRRCYSVLLEEREKRYRNIADVSIPYQDVKNLSGDKRLDVLRKALPQEHVEKPIARPKAQRIKGKNDVDEGAV